MVGNLKVGDRIRETRIRFRNLNGYEAYINIIDQDYDSQDTIFDGYIYKLSTPQFKKVKRSQYGNGCSFDKKLLNFEEINALYQQKDTVSLNVLIICLDEITNKSI